MGECLIVRSGSRIDTSNATASGNKIVEGYSCYVDDELITGDVPVMKLTTSSITPSNKIDISYGYYDNTNLISVSTLREETVATAVSSDLLIDNTGWSNGTNIIGTIHNNGAIAQSFGTNGSYTIPQGWHNGTGKVTQALTLKGPVGITPTTWNQTVCDAGRWTTGEQWVWGNGNLVPWNIKNGVEIFGVWGNFTGWVDNGGPAYNPCAELNIFYIYSLHEEDKATLRYFVRNVCWKGWNYFNIRFASSFPYRSRIHIGGLRLRTNQTDPGEFKSVQGDPNARFDLPISLPDYVWSTNSPCVSKQALSESLKANLAQWYGSGNIPVVFYETINNEINACDEKIFWFSLS